jgi:hypothetical protein
LLELFEGWVKPFSNTIGYFIVDAIGCGSTITSNIKDITGSSDVSSELLKAIQSINKNKSMFINEFSVDETEFNDFINEMSKARLLKNQDERLVTKFKHEMYQHVIAKHVIGKIIWYLLAGTLIASITYNNIINMTCDRTMSEIRSQYDNLFRVEQTYKGTRWKQITTEERDDGNELRDSSAQEKLKTYFEDRFTTDYVTLSNDDLRLSGLSYITLKPDSHIIMNGLTYKAIA